MDQEISRLPYLFSRYKDGTSTPAERQALMNLLRNPLHEQTIQDLLGEEIDNMDFQDLDNIPEISEESSNEIFARVLETGKGGIVVPIIDRRRKPQLWWAAAAILIVVLGGAYLFTYNNNRTNQTEVASNIKHDASPGTNKAILTTGEGKQIVLDSSAKGIISHQGNVTVKNVNGQLAYNQNGDETKILTNTITVPKGGQYKLILADGSKVWLNSASSLTYPTAFTGESRKVTLTGEGYFEIQHNASMPFHVIAGEMDVQDLGTSFNINAYADEATTKTTLLEGSVKIGNSILKPGQQALVNKTGIVKINNEADVEEAIAWKNGVFDFERADMATIMRQIARWYDLDVEYKGAVPEREFRAKMSRNTNASEVLKILEASKIHYVIEGKKITIMP